MRSKLSVLFIISLLMVSVGLAKERSGRVIINIRPKITKKYSQVRLWLPYPVSSDHQRISNLKVEDTANNTVIYREPRSGNLYLYAEWSEAQAPVELVMKFDVKNKEIKAQKLVDKGLPLPVGMSKYLKNNYCKKTDQELYEIASRITKNKRGILAKAKAVYDWVVENTYRDPGVAGCGLGQADITLHKRGGKCADITSVFIALARSAGVPAREVFGLRLSKKKEQDMSKGYHCWAEFYLPGTGWVQVDPADVRKLMLVKGLDLKQAEKYRHYYFGSVEEYRMVLAKDAIDTRFYPEQSGSGPHYFMYPYAEIDGKPLDYFNADNFAYSVKFEEI